MDCLDHLNASMKYQPGQKGQVLELERHLNLASALDCHLWDNLASKNNLRHQRLHLNFHSATLECQLNQGQRLKKPKPWAGWNW